jgi:hypothetical protein
VFKEAIKEQLISLASVSKRQKGSNQRAVDFVGFGVKTT